MIEEKVSQAVVIGSGLTGLLVAIKLASHFSVTIITKEELKESNTEHAQGGIAAAISKGDSSSLHAEDTLVAGAGLCDEEAVRIITEEGPRRIKELIELGTKFDKTSDGRIALTLEGAHSKRRVLHAQGDATGREIERALIAKLRSITGVEVHQHTFALDLIMDDSHCTGVIAFDTRIGRLRAFRAPVVVLATGGIGQIYKYTTNPELTTGDGVAMAYRAGAEIMDMEFVQFHPTSLCFPPAPRFLISEAVRGEGAILRNSRGEAFMSEYHPLADLAPRDIVSRSVIQEMKATNVSNVHLDLTHLSPSLIKRRFPTIVDTCSRYGLDIINQQIPVAPAAHYLMGGVKVDTYGRSNVEGLFVGGEIACTGVHGANRLASNSLLECVVFGSRLAEFIIENGLPTSSGAHITPDIGSPKLSTDLREVREKLREVMWDEVGIIRSEEGLKRALAKFEELRERAEEEKPPSWELKNMLTVSELVARAALSRTESRGAHHRVDYPERDDTNWLRHIILRR